MNRSRVQVRIVTVVLLLWTLGCDEASAPPSCEQWIACYSECSARAVSDLDEDTILACDVGCRVDLDISPAAPSPEPLEVWRGATWQVVVSQERAAVRDQLDAVLAEQDDDIDWALFLAHRSESDLANSLKARGECFAYGW